MKKLFGNIGEFISGEQLSSIQEKLDFADIKYSARDWVGTNIIAAVLISIFVTISVFIMTSNTLYTFIAATLAAFIYYLIVTTIVGMLSDQRAMFIESILPDALLLIASNLRAGLPTDEAVILSARPEFDFFAEKIKMAGREISTGTSVEKAFLKIPKGISSPVLDRTIDLIVEGVESGGEIATLLEETSADIRDTAILRKEVRSIIFVYAIFIFIAAVVTAPVLYGISTHLSETLSRLSGEISVAFLTKEAPTLTIKPAQFTSEFLVNFAFVNIIITSIFGSLMVALITRGNEKYGIRYIPIFIAISLILFFVIRTIIAGFFGAIKI